MNIYLRYLIEVPVLIVGIGLFVWLFILKSRNDRKINMRDASLTSEELEDHAKKTALEHSVSNKQNFLNWPVPRMNDNYEFILSVYKGLNEDIQKKYTVPSSAEWLLDNFYIIEEQVKGLRRDLIKKNYLRLPVLRSGLLKGYARIFAVAVELVAHTNGQMDEVILLDYMKAYQTHSVLFDREILAIPIVMRLALIENIRNLCENIKSTQLQWHKADEIFNDWLANEKINTNRVMRLFKDSLKTIDGANPSFIEHLFYHLRRSGRNYTKVLRTMDENLIRLGETTEHITQKEHSSQSVNTVSMGNCITSLRFFSTLDWSDLFESASFVEQILKQDPDGTYPRMDLFTRNYYRSKIEELASIYGVSELHIAREAVELAKQAYLGCAGSDYDDEIKRTWHVGYYLIGKGIKSLENRQEKKKEFLPKVASLCKKNPGVFYLGSIALFTLLLVAIAVQYSILTTAMHVLLFFVLVGIVVLIPSSEIAVNAVNWIVCKALKPAIFPRLELKDGIPESMSTIVVVPSLLTDERRVKELLDNLESHYLSNREENLFFALIGAFRDSDDSYMKDDGKIIKAALSGVKELNSKYSVEGRDKFYFFHRESQFNEKNNNWIGWERKRGALMEFGDLVLGSVDTSFTYTSCIAPPFSNVKYIITLDSDTMLPMGMAKKMIGTMAHPLNRPVIDKKRGVVVEGYGLMQPRIDVDSESSNKSFFSRIITGQEGIDPYANAISDVYQDLFGEGIFTGKGIYDLKVFQSVLKNAIPENAILSHDLLEGSYVRTGLVTDLKLVDSYPSKYNSYASRLHRWVRGDWQLFPLLYGKIFNRNNRKISNPLSLLSKWKMLDNLRRSLISPSLMILVVLSFSILPGSIYFWLGFLFVTMAFPLLMAVVGYVLSGQLRNSSKRHKQVMAGLKAASLQVFMALIFLPYQAWLMLNAIVVTLTRVFITKKNLLEWVTSEDVEKTQKNSLGSYVSKMKVSLWVAPIILILAIVFKPETTITSLFFLVLWMTAPFIAYWISKDLKEAVLKVSEEDMYELGRISRKTWRYFEEFTDAKNHYLTPDNYQADPPRGVAYRTSPTNIGFGLLATLTARDFGYIGTYGMMDLIEKTVTTIEGLIKWNGHLYNWYDTRTLKPLRPCYISTVDSGNLIGYLITLEQGLKDYLNSPLVDARFSNGIRDTLHCDGKEGLADYDKIVSLHMLRSKESVDLIIWNQTLSELIISHIFDNIKDVTWKTKIDRMVRMFKKDLTEFIPAIDLLTRIPDDLLVKDFHEDIASGVVELLNVLKKNIVLQDLPKVYSDATDCTDRLIEIIQTTAIEKYTNGLTWLYELKETLTKAASTTELFVKRYKTLIERVIALSEAMKFLPLYDKKKQLFSIGYNLDESKLTNSYYDLLASEARQTSYICIARGEIPSSHWFKMGRALTVVDGYKGLVSWTGTMFEYLMPLLIMKSYKNTLLDETYSFVIKSQKKYGRERNMPWGTSESGFNSLDMNHDYQYKAIGVPWLGLKRGLIEDAVAAPYATFLALLVDPEGAIHNIKRLKAEGLDGSYGFYEAADYTPERLLFEKKRAIVKSFMAHHQGMSLLALNNYLNKNIMQKRFNADPAIRAARLLLQEKIPANIVFTKENKEKVVPLKEAVFKEKSSIRKFNLPDPILPKAHILSNGNYSIMITDRGTGYSKNEMVAVTRWREDSTLDSYGMFFYLRDVDTNSVWSAAYSPLNIIPDKYEVVFTADKATFKRMDGQIETETEVVVTTGDNAEIRRISLKNFGEKTYTLEVTSYFEVVLASQAADVAHPVFSNLFIKTEFQPSRKCIIANRRPRSETDKCLWIASAAVLESDTFDDIQYETDRMQMIGRGHNVKTPIVMEQSKPLSNTVGPVLDPIMSLRVRVKIEPGKTAHISFVTAVSESNESLLYLIDKYASPETVEEAFRLALTRSQVETKYLNLDVAEMELYQNTISHILFISPMRKINQDLIMQNRMGQSSLWRYGISGDLPVVLVVLKKTDQVEILYEILKAHEYWRLMDLKVDLVILSEEEYSYTLPLYALISDIVLSRQTHDILKRPGDVFILDKNKMPIDDVNLLYAFARVTLKGDGKTMYEQLNIQQNYTLPNTKQFMVKAAQYSLPAASMPELLFSNGLGGFNTDGSEYVIRLEKGQNTPAPWVNVIANPEFGFMVSEAGSGYTWCANSRENKLTPWSNDVVSDSPGEVLYVGDGDTGELWTVTSLPIREDECYTISHGFGYSIFEHTSHGIEQKLTQYVPLNKPVKVSIISTKNISDQKRNLTLTYYIRPVLGVSDQVTAIHIKTSLGSSGTLMIENPYNEEFAGRICFIDASVIERSVTSDRKEFFGSGNISSPDSLYRETLSGAMGTGLDPCAAIQVKITLEPNENKDIIFLLGMATQLIEVNELTQQFIQIEEANQSLNEVKKFWKDKMDIAQVNTPTVSMNLMLNGWLQYQVISCRLWARSGFYQSGGAFGFRDQLQDCLSIAHLWPEVARAQILLHARHQFTQGDVQHWWHEPLGKGIRTRFSDDLLWLPFVTAEYIRITGDSKILEEELTFLEDTALTEYEDEKYGKPNVSKITSSLFDHCVRAVDISLKFGEHGLPLMGTGDWNDGMNTVGNKGFGESVWLGWFLASILKMFSLLCIKMGDDKKAEEYTEMRATISEALEKNAWDGNWYKRAYFDNGLPLGSVQNNECKIDSIAQTWAVISGVGNPQREVQAMNSLEDYLVMREDGLIKLLTPPFDEGDMEPGYIKGYLPGVRENGGQYTHAAVWVIIAFAKLGDGDKAWELFELINPINHTSNQMQYSRYKVEPYVMAADVYTVHPHIGRGGWSWYTGAAGWMYRAGLEFILGFQKNGDTIIIDPCIPSKWREYSIKYKFHDTMYNIKVTNPQGLNKGVKEISIDGKMSEGNRINLVNDRKSHDVEVFMGL
jgi:cyclic beta-1,2-glucan synthetase